MRRVVLLQIDDFLPRSRTSLLYAMKYLKQAGIDVALFTYHDRRDAIKQFSLDVLDSLADHVFYEDGAVYFRSNTLVFQDTLEQYMEGFDLNRVISWILAEIASCKCPLKKGSFLQRKTRTLQMSPIGQSCSYVERNQFVQWDTDTKCRQGMATRLETNFPQWTARLRGDINIDIMPKTVHDETLRFLSAYDQIHVLGNDNPWGDNVRFHSIQDNRKLQQVIHDILHE